MVHHRLIAVVATLTLVAWVAPALAESPEATVRRVAAGLADQQPAVLWDALPPSYQREATALIHDYAAAVDPALHARGVGVGRKAVVVLRAQRDLILGSQLAAGFAADRGRAEKGWDAMVGILDTLLRSDLADLGKVRSLDPGAFLRSTGRQVMQLVAEASKGAADDPYANAFAASVEGLKVEVVESSADAATLRLTPASRPSRDLRLVRVEGRWVPDDFAGSWASTVADGRAQIAAMSSPEASQQKTQVLMGLAMVEGLLDQVAAMKTPQELDAAFQGLVAGFAAGQPPPSPTE